MKEGSNRGFLERRGSIVICDGSALHMHLHCDGPSSIGALRSHTNPLNNCATSAEDLCLFNTEHPLYGGEPIDILVPSMSFRRSNELIESHLCSMEPPPDAFIKLRDGLYATSPELTFARMAYGFSETRIARIGTDLCARYYLDVKSGEVEDRSEYLTSPKELRAFLGKASGMRGATKALKAMKWVFANSGSPAETQMFLQYARPMRNGGFGLPFHALNYDVKAGRSARISEQGKYCIDMVNLDCGVGVEYDGKDYHLDVSADQRRRNALAALGWQLFVLDRRVLYDAEATERAAYQIARKLGVRIRKPQRWESRYVQLRTELGLPIA